MSNSFYSDSFTSGDYKPSNYTDFSSSNSSSYSSDQDSNYKKFDDYSSSNNNSYSNYDAHSNNTQSSFSDFNSYENHHNLEDQQSSDTGQKYQNDSFSSQDAYFSTGTTPQQVSQPLKLSQSQQSNMSPQPTKTIQKFTVRDVLDLPQPRQQYLKSLPIENLRQQPEYKVMLKRQSVLLGILDYYEKIIPDKELNSQVRSLKRGKDIKESLWIGSIITYLVLTGKMQRPGSTFKGVFKGRSHMLIPFGLTALMMFDNRNTRVKTSLLLKDSRSIPSIDIAMRKFICDTSHKQRVQIFGQS